MTSKSCNVRRKDENNGQKLGMGSLLLIAVVIVISGISVIVLSIFLPITMEQSASLSGVGVPLFIFGLVMFGIMLSSYVKKVK